MTNLVLFRTRYAKRIWINPDHVSMVFDAEGGRYARVYVAGETSSVELEDNAVTVVKILALAQK